MELDKAYKKIFSSKNLHENLSKINGEYKDNDLVKEVINFISKDKMLNINKDYLSHKTETDIITFDYTDLKKIEAEIYLCYSIIKP